MSCGIPTGGFIPDEDLPQGGRTITRKSYTRKNGTHVPQTRIRDVGAPGKWTQKHGPGIGPLKEGELEHVGYDVTKGEASRHRAVKKAVKRYGALSTFRKLNAVSTYTKRTNKTRSNKFKKDRNWVRKEFM